MVTLKGYPAPLICDYLSREASRAVYAEGTEFHIGRIDMIANTGTYVDSPFHRYADGKDLSELPLESLADLECLVVRHDLSRGPTVDNLPFTAKEVRGRAVLVHTTWDRNWRADRYFENNPHLSADVAKFLVDAGAALVGIDSLNIDDTRTGARPVHTTLLGNKVPIVEHMRGLEQIPDRGSRFHAVPVKVKGLGTFPVRAFAIVE